MIRNHKNQKPIECWGRWHFPLSEPSLEWEITYVDEGKSQLSICFGGGGSFPQWRLLETFVARAGEFGSWEIVAARVPLALTKMRSPTS